MSFQSSCVLRSKFVVRSLGAPRPCIDCQVLFYQTLGSREAVAAWPFHVPRAVVVEAGLARTLVAMQDIRALGARQYTPFDVGSPLQHVPVADAVVFTRALGRLQAQFWGKHFAPPGLAVTTTSGDRLCRTLFSIALPAALKGGKVTGQLAQLCVAAGARGGTVGVARLLHAAWTGPTTFVHGDMNTGNVYMLPDGTPGLLDFQTWMVRLPSPLFLFFVLFLLVALHRSTFLRGQTKLTLGFPFLGTAVTLLATASMFKLRSSLSRCWCH